MEETNIEKHNVISINEIASALWSKRWLFIKVWVITFALSCLWILPQPRTYSCDVSLAPESSEGSSGEGLASLASNFGLNIGMGGNDAISPDLYPDLLKSTNFSVGLFDVQVETSLKKENIRTDYYTYLKKHQKANWLLAPIFKLANRIKKLLEKSGDANLSNSAKAFDSFRLSKTETKIMKVVQEKVKCSYSKTTGIVTISVTDQDPLVCAQLADSVMSHLQAFLTAYRTQKARIDYEHYRKLADEALINYEQSRLEYAKFCDANRAANQQSILTKIDAMENDMQLKYNILTAITTQLQASMAKLQEATPAFTTLRNATVPVKPSGPKRMVFVTVMLILSTLGTIAYNWRKELMKWF
ncbi:MAG: chain-length determining protein [Bacteroidaceae bacterium]|nr:chain-length determining protein [Bacteroidaceae bacterium]